MKTFYFLSDETADKVIHELNGRQQIEIAKRARIHNTSLSKIMRKRIPMSLITFERLLGAGYLDLRNYPELRNLPNNITATLERLDAMNKLTRAA